MIGGGRHYESVTWKLGLAMQIGLVRNMWPRWDCNLDNPHQKVREERMCSPKIGGSEKGPRRRPPKGRENNVELTGKGWREKTSDV